MSQAWRVTFKLNTALTEKATRKLADRAPKAIARALNRSIVTARTTIAKAVAADVSLKLAEVRAGLVTIEAYPQPSGLAAALFAKVRRIPLVKFKASGPEPSKGKGVGVSARVEGQRKRYPSSFFATFRSGHRGVFVRQRERFARPSTIRRRRALRVSVRVGRLPITELHGPSLEHVAKKYAKQAAIDGRASLVKNLNHEIEFLSKQP